MGDSTAAAGPCEARPQTTPWWQQLARLAEQRGVLRAGRGDGAHRHRQRGHAGDAVGMPAQVALGHAQRARRHIAAQIGQLCHRRRTDLPGQALAVGPHAVAIGEGDQLQVAAVGEDHQRVARRAVDMGAARHHGEAQRGVVGDGGGQVRHQDDMVIVLPNPWYVGSAGLAWSLSAADNHLTRRHVFDRLRDLVVATNLPVKSARSRLGQRLTAVGRDRRDPDPAKSRSRRAAHQPPTPSLRRQGKSCFPRSNCRTTRADD